jgi:hypothetical protein
METINEESEYTAEIHSNLIQSESALAKDIEEEKEEDKVKFNEEALF